MKSKPDITINDPSALIEILKGASVDQVKVFADVHATEGIAYLIVSPKIRYEMTQILMKKIRTERREKK